MACAVDEADKAFAADVLGGCFGQGGDFAVVVEERVAGKSGQDAEVVRTEFKVWSVLLSQWSRVFHTMITSTSFREKAAAEVVIQDFSATTVEAFLRFLYSGVLRGSLATTVEVGMLADKYQVDKLQSLCKQAVQKQLRPETACELLQLADRCQNADLRLQALEKILIHPKDALRLRPAISPRLLDEVLSSPFLCVEQEELFQLLQGWGKRKASALDDDLQPVIDNHTVVVVGRKQARYSFSVLGSLWNMYERGGKEGPFLGYWVNVTLGNSDVVKAETETKSMNKLRDVARNHGSVRMEKGWISWMLPHHCVYIMGIVFLFAAHAPVSFDILSSLDGLNWHVLFSIDHRVDTPPNLSEVPIQRPPEPAKWFKLQVREGVYENSFSVRGILRQDATHPSNPSK
ncbi:bath-40 [Symbiodinium sp. CCMP2456]|nr:bath-40 [Symbiodinium sp. CCMP2456]